MKWINYYKRFDEMFQEYWNKYTTTEEYQRQREPRFLPPSEDEIYQLMAEMSYID